jgi:uncharacterized protein
MISRLVAAATLAVVLCAGSAAQAAAPTETYVQVQGPSGLLKGTMLTPPDAAKAPVVLIIPGSGPTDRDGNSPMGIKAAPYRLLAEALAANGVASVRIDKRGMFASGAAAADPNHVTIADYAADAHAWAAEIRRETGAPCVWILGHSEGGLVALAAAQNPTDICGLVLVSAAGRRLSDVLREQLKANPANAPILDQALPAIDALEAGKHVDVTGMNPALLSLFAPQVQDFVIDLMSYDPPKLVAAYKGPVLVVQGTTDLQVSMTDAERLAGARPGVTLVKLDGVNHVLKTAPLDRAGNFATYADPSLPLAPGVAGPIAAFVKGGGAVK